MPMAGDSFDLTAAVALPSTTTESPRPASTRRKVLVTFAISTVVGLALGSQVILSSASFGRQIPWLAAMLSLLRETWLWAALVPMVFAISRRFPFQQETWWKALTAHLFGALAAALVFSALNTVVIEWLTPESLKPSNVFGPRHPPSSQGSRPPGPPPQPPPLSHRFWFGFAGRFQPNVFSYALIVFVWHWLDHQRRLRERERQAQDLSRQLAEARLQALRMQLNPHFLFNTLNAIATLVHRDPQSADEMIACLSDFLRLTLNSQNTPESPLRTELEFARRYLDIEKVRFGDRLTVIEDIPPDALGVAIPTLLLQPLLENAIRHGIERSEEAGRINLLARRDSESFVLRVGNTGPTSAPGGLGTREGGVGLANTRARLRELYGTKADLTLTQRDAGGLDVEIRLPWRVSPSTRAVA